MKILNVLMVVKSDEDTQHTHFLNRPDPLLFDGNITQLRATRGSRTPPVVLQVNNRLKCHSIEPIISVLTTNFEQ